MTDRRTTTLKISAHMPSPDYCAECAGRLCEAVAGVPGVLSVECDSRGGEAQVAYDADVLPADELQREATKLGYEVGASVAHASYRLTGLD